MYKKNIVPIQEKSKYTIYFSKEEWIWFEFKLHFDFYDIFYNKSQIWQFQPKILRFDYLIYDSVPIFT